MSDQETGQWIPDGDQVAAELRLAVHVGDVEAVRRLLRSQPALATARLGSKETGSATALHLVTDWPGYFPNGPQIVRRLIDAGADPNAPTTSRGAETSGPGDETPLHYAASSDDADVAEALIDGGAEIETPLGSIGTPLDNAVGYACWHVARLLVARGARVDKAYLLSRGADLNWEPDYAHGTPLDATTGLGTRQENVLTWLRGLGARSATSD
jgi:uncharacterized protein